MEDNNISPSQKVLNYICERIKNKQLVEGDRLPTENDLSEILDVGRNSVREALKISSYLGLTTSVQGSGHKITSNLKTSFLTSTQLLFELLNFNYKDISNVREALEIKTVQLIINQGISNDNLNLLYEYIDYMEKDIDSHEYDLKFHLKLADLSGNALISHLAFILSNACDSYILISWKNINSEDKSNLIKYHKDILISICEKKDYIPAILNHYGAADKIIQKENSLFNNVPLNYNILEKLKGIGVSDEQIKDIFES